MSSVTTLPPNAAHTARIPSRAFTGIAGMCALAAMAAAAVAVIVAGPLRGVSDQVAASARVTHTQEVLLCASDLHVQVQTAISEARGYRLNHTPDDLARVDDAARRAKTDQDRLRALAADNPVQQETLRRLGQLIAQRLGMLRSDAGLAADEARDRFSRATPAEATAVMTKLVAGIDALETEATRLLALRRAAVAQARQRTLLAVAIGGATLFASVGFAMLLVHRRRQQRRDVATLSQANRILNARVRERTLELAMVADALRDREAHQRRVLDHAPFAMAILSRLPDGQHRYDYMNLACLETYGQPPEAYVGHTVREIWPSETADMLERRLTACTERRETFASLIEHAVHGDTRFLDGALAPLPRDAHGPRQVLECTRDVTAKVKLEQLVASQVTALRAAEERQRRLFEATPAMAMSFDRRGRLLAVSDAWLAGLGLAREAAVGRTVFEFLTPASQDHCRSAIVRQLTTSDRITGLECQAVRHDGTVIDVLASATMERDRDGAPWRGHAVVEDVTRRRLAEQALLHERQRLANLIAATGVGTWEWDLRSGELLVNARYWEILGMAGAPAPSFHSAVERVHPDEADDTREKIRKLLAGEISHFEHERRLRHQLGHYVWVLSRASVIVSADDGGPEWIIGAVQDISASKLHMAALRKSEEFLERTGRCAGVGGWELDLASGQIVWTAETGRIHGVPPGHVPALAEAIDFYAPEARPVIKAAMDRCLADGTGWDLELPFVRTDGTPIWVRAMGGAVLEGGQPVRLIGAFQDVTHSVTQRLALREANERVALATEGADIGIWGWDVASGLMHWDACTRRHLGSPVLNGAPTYETWLSLLHPQDRAETNGTMRRSAAQMQSYAVEFRVLWRDGSEHHIRAVAQVSADSPEGGARIMGVNWDVTESRMLARERDRQTALLAESEANFRLIAENSKDMISRVGADGERVYASAGTHALLGISAQELMARGLAAMVHPEDFPRLQAAQCSLLDGTSDDASITFRVRNPQRGLLWVETSAKAVTTAHGGRAGYIAISRDVTERVCHEAEREARAQELLEANQELDGLARRMAEARNTADRASRAKTRFLAGMSHELRTPLNGILGYAQLLRMDGDLSPTQSARVHAMLRAGRHLLDMIGCVLDLSEIETGTIEIHPGCVDIIELAEACMAMVKPAAEEKGLALRLDARSAPPRRMVSDGPRLRQILLNLLGNAVKYTASGRVELGITTFAASEPAAAVTGTSPDRIRFEVADTGPGIPATRRHLLFEEFKRLGGDDAGASEGAGLGLYLAKRLAGALGGDLTHAENPGGGSVFALDLPLVCHADGAAMTPDETEAGRSGSEVDPASLPPILVVDDVSMNRDIAASFLRSAGYHVICAEDGAEAVARAGDQDFLVIMMDVRMPGMDGLEATRRIRALPAARGRVPIVALTAQAFTEQIEACRQAGMDTHLAKPFTLQTLLDAVSRGVAAGRGRSTGAARPEPGADLPALNAETLDRTAAFLNPDALFGYLKSLSEQIETLQCRLAEQRIGPADAESLAAAAHTLAGSAGLFGCDRLVFMARDFEAAVAKDPEYPKAAAASLQAALDATLPAIRMLERRVA